MKYLSNLSKKNRYLYLSILFTSALFGSAFAEDMPEMDHSKMDHSTMDHSKMDHSQHQAMLGANLKRTVVELNVPATKLLRQDGSATVAQTELTSGKPTIVAFIYTSCTTICPLTSQIMSEVQGTLGSMGMLDDTRMASISIDPEYDTPARLMDYAKKFGASPQWTHYTGTLANSVTVQKAFKAYQGDKMNHLPLIFINGGGKKNWVRLEGFPTAAQVVKELHDQMGG
jgi:protein SCO1/2